MASSSSSSHSVPASISQSWNYDAFLSFRGEDTRKGFVDHLYTALQHKGIYTYKDDETLPRGESIGPALLKAIEDSRIAVVVFSKNYADSSWCLAELAHIIECVDKRGQILMPIFYYVDPSDVRKLKRKYEEAFSKHERENKENVETWRKALEKAGSISGWTINDTINCHEAKCISDIVGTVSSRLSSVITNDNKELIGIGTRLRDLKSMLEIGSGGVRMVGIWGVGGGGKTTLASAAYMEISHQFEACCLVENIREESSKHGLKRLQEKILSVALKTTVVVDSEIEGRSMIKKRLCHKRVLVVLDDVDDLEQLEALAGSHDWFGEGSRIIITTRDKHLLSSRAHTNIYEVSLLSHYEAIKLFNRHAYHKDKPIEDYEKLSLLVVSYAGGLPLALKVLGSFLYDKDKDEWKSTLAKLKCTPEEKVMERLKISYDGLEPCQKDLFLDIACFMRRWTSWEMDDAMMVLDACNLHPVIGLKVLEQKSLIKVVDGEFEMHDLIEEMAHYIVRGEHPNNLEKHSRIWKWKDIEYLCDMGAAAPSMENEVLADLPRYIINHPGLFDVLANMKNLRWIVWDKHPASSFPSNFQPTKLRCLMWRYSQQKKLWEGCKSLPNLKILHLSSSANLIKTPDFEGLPCLERLILRCCESLEEIHPSIGYHKRLVYVDMSCCLGLKRFPPIIHMKKLETLILLGCEELQQFPDIQSNMDSLVTLDLRWTGIEIITPSIGLFCTNLVYFYLHGCQKLKRIEGNLHLLKSLKDLDFGGCDSAGLQFFHQDRLVGLKLFQFPRSLRKLDLSYGKLGDGDIPSDIFCELLNVQLLNLSGNNFSRLPFGLSQLPGLKILNLSHCINLVELPDLPSSIAILKANGCDSLEIARDLSYCKWLWKVSLWKRANMRVLLSVLEENAVKEDRFMSVLSTNVEPSSIYTKLVTLQLPHNWDSDFSGFLLSLRGYGRNHEIYRIVIKQEMSTDHPEEFGEDWEKYDSERVGYVPFSSLRHIPWINPTYTKNISFQTNYDGGLNVEIVRSKIKIGDLNEHPIDYSECWDEEYEDNKTFEILYDSNSSEIQIAWYH
ncbi:putative TIR domain, P-loop containing nucleoside triphosphate hydrolase [Helianthus annuus]|nr:putative TIR domain, P-loop containing nucleoside triphosphate hydrolase [Helianthus annuus]